MNHDRDEERAEHQLIQTLGCGCNAHCRVCGCGDFHSCEPPCGWVNDPLDLGPLCSACLPTVEQAIEQLQTDLAVLEALELIERHAVDDDVRWLPTAKGLQLDPANTMTRDQLLRTHVRKGAGFMLHDEPADMTGAWAEEPEWIRTAPARYESEHGRGET